MVDVGGLVVVGLLSGAEPLLAQDAAGRLVPSGARGGLERHERLGEVVVGDGRVPIVEREIEPERRLLENVVVLPLALDLVAARALEIRLKRRDAAELAFDLGVLAPGKDFNRRRVRLRGVGEIGQSRFDSKLERALSGANGLGDAHAVVVEVERAALVAQALQGPVEPVVLDLVVGRSGCSRMQPKIGAQVAPPLDVGRRGDVASVRPIGKVEVR